MTTSRVHRWLAVGITAAVLGTGSGCSDTPSQPPVPVEVSAVTMNYQFATSAPRCTGTVNWLLQPRALSGSSGSSSAITDTQTYDVVAGGGRCTFSMSATGMRRGTWLIGADIANSCEVSLQKPNTAVTFERGKPGCVVVSGL